MRQFSTTRPSVGLGHVVHAHLPVGERADDHLRDLPQPLLVVGHPRHRVVVDEAVVDQLVALGEVTGEEHLVGEAADDVTVCSHGSPSESARMALRVLSPRRGLSSAWPTPCRALLRVAVVRRETAPKTRCGLRVMDAAAAARGLHRRGHRRPELLRASGTAAATRCAGPDRRAAGTAACPRGARRARARAHVHVGTRGAAPVHDRRRGRRRRRTAGSDEHDRRHRVRRAGVRRGRRATKASSNRSHSTSAGSG